jgi:plasmid stabilization system protein ParE
MFVLFFHPSAQLELAEAIAYYDNINSNFGDTFLKATEGSLSLIVQFPEAWTPMIENTRRCHIKGFPYGIVYRTQGDRIQVLAVMHLQRKPNYWLDRD